MDDVPYLVITIRESQNGIVDPQYAQMVEKGLFGGKAATRSNDKEGLI